MPNYQALWRRTLQKIDGLMNYCTRVHLTALRNCLLLFFNTCSCSELFFLKICNNTKPGLPPCPFRYRAPMSKSHAATVRRHSTHSKCAGSQGTITAVVNVLAKAGSLARMGLSTQGRR